MIRKFFPGFLKRVIMRLQSADTDNHDLEDKMYAEDEYLKVLINRDNKISYYEEQIEKKDKALYEKDKLIEEQKRLIEKLTKK